MSLSASTTTFNGCFPCQNEAATTVLQSNSFRFSGLPGSRRESKVVLSFGIAHSVVLLGAEANHDRLGKLDLSQFKVIHFATHAISGGDLASSFILLGCQNRFDALLGREILAEKLDGQLVVLSTCNALEGEQLSQEWTDSIAYGFLMAGARNVVASRMRIRDEIAQELMTQFYRALSEGNSVEHSLRLAQLHFSRPDSNPAEWVAFAVEGMGGTLPTMTSSMMERISGVWIADFSVRWSFILFLFLILSYLGWRGIRRRVTLERK
jgi:CHAT domain-containing protein